MKPHQPHQGGVVQIGPYRVFATGRAYLSAEKLAEFPGTVLVPLTAVPDMGREIIDLQLPDFGGVPPDWQDKLEALVIPRLAAGDTMLAFCVASHGRTGTFLASLIALLESAEETPDPIQAVRERHCCEAVETLEQAEGIFALRGQPVPQQYQTEFARPAHTIPSKTSQGGKL